MEGKWFEIYERLVNTDTGYERSIEEKIKETTFIGEILEDLGMNVRTGKASYIATKGEPPFVTLIGHLDTVFKKGEPIIRPFRVEGNVAFGPGVADMKGGVVLILATLEEFLKSTKNLPVAVVLNVDEEIGSPKGKIDHYEMAKSSFFCLSYETGRKNEAIVLERKGIAALEVEMKGKAGHASIPESGANAMIEMADKILKISELSKRFENLTVVPTISSSGYKSNVIPESAYIFFDVRYKSVEELKKLRVLLEDVFQTKKEEGVESYYTLEVKRPPMRRYEIAERVARSAMERMGVNYDMLSVGGGGDAAFYTESGVPAIDGLGIVGRYIHSEKEEAYLDTFDSRLAFSLTLLEEVFRSSNRR